MENFGSTFEKRLQGAVKWSYMPYRPCMFQAGDIIVTRIVPDEHSIYLEWINECGNVCLMYKKHDDTDFIQACTSDSDSARLTGLTTDTDYEFYLKTPDGRKSSGTLEGTFAVLPDDKLYMLARYGIGNCIPDYGLALMYKVNTDDPSAPLEFSRTVKFDGNHSKFTVLRDPESGNYYSIVSYIRSSKNNHDRNLLALLKSEDCINWKPVCYPIDFSDRPAQKFGLQYVDFIFDNDDIMFLCRTATNGADNFHNSNCITFHVINNFRSL